MKIHLFLIIVFVQFSFIAKSQQFEEITPVSLTKKHSGNIVFADLNNDGYQDFIQSGYGSLTIFINNKGTFEKLGDFEEFKGETSLYVHSIDLGDFDKDGYVDILQTGGPNERVSYLIKNDSLTFTNLASFGEVSGACYFGDIENDGDLDVLYSYETKAYRNTILSKVNFNINNTLVDKGYILRQPTKYAFWADLDRDSEIEIIQSEGTQYGFKGNFFLEPNEKNYEIVSQISISHNIHSINVADYNNDGYVDLLVKGHEDGFKIYRFANGDYVDIGVNFPYSLSGIWADMNNDGLPDVLLGGAEVSYNTYTTRVYFNSGDDTFSDFIDFDYDNSLSSNVAVSDIDHDGDLDLGIAGENFAKIYKNLLVENAGPINNPPSKPGSIEEEIIFTSVTLKWEGSTDIETPNVGLTYNISVVKDDGTIVVPSHAFNSGLRKINKPGNANNILSYSLNCIQEGTYKWKVQAIDAGYSGSSFSDESTFTIENTAPQKPINLSAKTLSDYEIELIWKDASSNETEYKIYRKVEGEEYAIIDTIEQNTTIFLDTFDLKHSTRYKYMVVASNCAYPKEFYDTISAVTFPQAFELTNWIDLGKASGTFALLGDYDNDMDLDLLLSYQEEYPNYGYYTKLFRFETNHFEDSGIKLPYINSYSSASWIDYNNDGFLDLFFTLGETFDFTFMLYENNEGYEFIDTEINIDTELGRIWQKGVVWGDYDSDGDLDILIQGVIDNASQVLRIYENLGNGIFEDSNITNLNGMIKSTLPWGDYDNDGDFDILMNQWIDCDIQKIVIYENNGDKSFQQKDVGNLTGLSRDLLNYTGDMKWGDYNQDGFLDIIVSGENTCSNGSGITKIYTNNGNKTFTELANADLMWQIYDVNVGWGDYDNDGDFDIFLYGDPRFKSSRTRIYSNDDNNQINLANIDYLIESSQHGMSTIGDIDNDGDLDLVILGEEDYTTPRIYVYKNTFTEGWGKTNNSPQPPTNLNDIVGEGSVTLTWEKAGDNETKQAGLTYNYYLVRNGDTLVVNSNSLSSGYRKIVGLGNAQHNQSITITNLEAGDYKWAVQSIDNGYRGSGFSEEKTFTVAGVYTGIASETIDHSINIFPNPTYSDKITLTINNQYLGKVFVKFTDVSGKNLRKIEFEKLNTIFSKEIGVNNLNDGIYFIKVLCDGKEYTKKLIRQ
jgi:hypothetical protein